MKNPDQSSLFVIAQDLLRLQKDAVLVEIVEAAGSTPRDKGTIMLVSGSDLYGTIGGGQLEWIASDKARIFMAGSKDNETIDIALGPEIGQCCGGKVVLKLSRLNPDRLKIIKESETPDRVWNVQIHGAGHTGLALCNALALLPFRVEVIDVREDALKTIPDAIRSVRCPIPETKVREAEPGTAFVIFTHEHNLDFLIAAEALKRGDAAYVGMIGSRTKRAVFKNWLADNDYEEGLEKGLKTPIGGSSVKDKRPEVIAAMVVAELLTIFSSGK